MSARRPQKARRGGRLTAAILAIAAASAGIAQPAVADDGQWWYSLYNVDRAHADGWTGAGVKIAVIGSMIDPSQPVLADADLTVDEDPICEGGTVATTDASLTALHDTTVTSLLVGNGEGAAGIRGIVPDAAVTFIGYGKDGDADCTVADNPEFTDSIDKIENELGQYGAALRRAIDDGAQIVTTSTLLGDATTADLDVVAEAIARGVVLVTGTLNADTDWRAGIPTNLRGVVAATAIDADGNLPASTSGGIGNFPEETTVAAAGAGVTTLGTEGDWNGVSLSTGSSIAAPLVAGMLAAASQKYPDATGNQLIQSLIHNTGAEDHELEYSSADGLGYGLASLSHLLRVDPTQYPDENPLLDKALDQPDDEQLAAAETALAASATPSPTPDPGGSSASGLLTGVLIAVSVVVVLLIAAAILTVVLVTRSRNKNRRNPS